MVENAADKTIVTSSNKLNFLTKYGLNVISVDETTLTDKTLSDAKKALATDSINYIFIIKGEEKSETVNSLLSENDKIKTLEIDTLSNISTEDKNDGKDYISIMNDNIIKPLMLKNSANSYDGSQNRVISEVVTNNITVRKVKKFDIADYIFSCLIPQNGIKKTSNFDELVSGINSG